MWYVWCLEQRHDRSHKCPAHRHVSVFHPRLGESHGYWRQTVWGSAFVRVRVCVCVRERERERESMCVSVSICVCVCVCVCEKEIEERDRGWVEALSTVLCWSLLLAWKLPNILTQPGSEAPSSLHFLGAAIITTCDHVCLSHGVQVIAVRSLSLRLQNSTYPSSFSSLKELELICSSHCLFLVPASEWLVKQGRPSGFVSLGRSREPEKAAPCVPHLSLTGQWQQEEHLHQEEDLAEGMQCLQPSLTAAACHGYLDIGALVFFDIKQVLEMGSVRGAGRGLWCLLTSSEISRSTQANAEQMNITHRASIKKHGDTEVKWCPLEVLKVIDSST
jgi:hypothetical protein